jgi:hypothetical protein
MNKLKTVSLMAGNDSLSSLLGFMKRGERGGGTRRRKLRIIEVNEKCRHLKKFTCKGTLLQMFTCLGPETPYPPLTHCILYNYSHREGGGGGELNKREGERGSSSQRRIETTYLIDCISCL